MIQRIQTIWLFLVAVLGILMYLPVTEKTELTPTFPYVLLLGIECGLIVALSIFSIFRYKKRRLQIQLGYWTLLLWVLVYVTIFLNVWWYGIEKIVAWKLPALFPLIAIVFTLLAIQAIKKDEKLVRSLDRLR
jgi:hypothetical protein